MAQRSIMSRAVLAPVDLDTGDVPTACPPGWTIATLLPLLNTSAAPGLDQWDPDRWHRHRLADPSALPSPLLVTAFGHGKHSCPAQPFSLAAMTAAMTHLLGRYEMTPGWTGHPRPVPAQIGGVARAADPCRYPLLRNAVASPLMVSRMPRWTSSSSSPERYRRSSSTCRWFSGSR